MLALPPLTSEFLLHIVGPQEVWKLIHFGSVLVVAPIKVHGKRVTYMDMVSFLVTNIKLQIMTCIFYIDVYSTHNSAWMLA